MWCEHGALLLTLALTLSLAAPAAPKPVTPEARLEQGQKLFNQGDFDGALKLLDAAEGGDAKVMEKVHLLRAQSYAARQEFVRAEEAFAQALEANPDAALDPARVDPTVVKLLESVRARLKGTVIINSTPPGATVIFDGRAAGLAPLTLTPTVGRHTLEAQWGDGPKQKLELQVHPTREARVEWVQVVGPSTAPAGSGLLVERPLRPFGDLRGIFEASTSSALGGGLELGGGIELSWFRLGAYFRLYPEFHVTPRFQFALPVHEEFNVLLEAAVPIAIGGGFGVGISGAGGAEWYPFKWLGFYALFGGRHYFIRDMNNDRTAFIVNGGVRLRVP